MKLNDWEVENSIDFVLVHFYWNRFIEFIRLIFINKNIL